MSNGWYVGDDVCEHHSLARPPSTGTCATQRCATYWWTGEFGPCSKPCEYGTTNRTVECRSSVTAEGVRVDDKWCDDPKPSATAICNAFPCPTWVTSDWGACVPIPGGKELEGKRNREVICLRYDNTVAGVEECSKHPMPATTETCTLEEEHHEGAASDTSDTPTVPVEPDTTQQVGPTTSDDSKTMAIIIGGAVGGVLLLAGAILGTRYFLASRSKARKILESAPSSKQLDVSVSDVDVSVSRTIKEVEPVPEVTPSPSPTPSPTTSDTLLQWTPRSRRSIDGTVAATSNSFARRRNSLDMRRASLTGTGTSGVAGSAATLGTLASATGLTVQTRATHRTLPSVTETWRLLSPSGSPFPTPSPAPPSNSPDPLVHGLRAHMATPRGVDTASADSSNGSGRSFGSSAAPHSAMHIPTYYQPRNLENTLRPPSVAISGHAPSVDHSHIILSPIHPHTSSNYIASPTGIPPGVDGASSSWNTTHPPPPPLHVVATQLTFEAPRRRGDSLIQNVRVVRPADSAHLQVPSTNGDPQDQDRSRSV